MRRALKFVISLVLVVALVAGLSWSVFQLGELYLNVIANSKAAVVEVKPGTEESGDWQVIKLPKFEVYSLQFGIFEEAANAEKQVKELEQKGIGAVVLVGKPNRVVAFYYGQATATKAELQLLKGVKPTEKSFPVNGLTFKVAPGDGERVGILLDCYGKVLSSAGTFFRTPDPNQLKIAELTKLVVETEALLAKVKDPTQKLQNSKNNTVGKELALALDKQGVEVVESLKGLIVGKNRAEYLKTQRNLLEMLTLYQQFLEIIQM